MFSVAKLTVGIVPRLWHQACHDLRRFWIFFLPVVVLGQVQTPNVQIHTQVPSGVSSSLSLQVLEEREQEVVVTTLLSAEPRTAPFEVIHVSEGELSQRSPALILPSFPHGGSSAGVFVSPIDPTDGFARHQWSYFKQMPGNVQNSLTTFGGYSKVAITESLVDTNYGNFAVVMDELPSEIEFTNSFSVMAEIADTDVTPQVCLKLSSQTVVGGDPVTVTATVDPVQKKDVTVEVDFWSDVIKSFLTINPSTITIPAGAKESTAVQYDTRWDYTHPLTRGWKEVYGDLIAKPDLPHKHSICLCPRIFIKRPPPDVTLSASPNPVDDGDPVTISARIPYALSSDLKVPLHYPNAKTTDTAFDPGDYTSLASITIKAYDTKGSGQIQTQEYTGVDDKMFTLAIDEKKLAAAAIMGDPNVVKVTITDNEIPFLHFALAKSSVNEKDVTQDVNVTIAPKPASSFTFSYTLGGTATEKLDYTITNSGSVFVPANATSVKIPVKIIADAEDERPDETIELTLDNGAEYGLGNPRTHELTINGPQVIRFASSKSSVNEDGGRHKVEILFHHPVRSPMLIKYTLGGNATDGIDYYITSAMGVPRRLTSVNLPVDIIDDAKDEHDEKIVLTLTSDGIGYELGSSREHTVTIVDNDPTVYFASATSSAEEGIGTQNVRVTLASAPASDLTLSYTLSGTAVEGTDYTIKDSGSVPVSAGATSVNIPVAITDDSEIEPDEDIILTLTSATGYTVGSQKEHTLTIADNDTPAAEFALVESSVPEDTGTHEIEVRIDPSPANDFTLSYTLGGTADEDSDYTITGSVLVSANATLVNIPVTIIDDQLDELDETVILTLTSGTGYSVGSQKEHTLTIEDNDTPAAEFALVESSVPEDTGTHEIEVRIDPSPANDFTLSYTLGGTADEDSDYTITGSVLVSANATLVNIPVTIIDDQLDELDETVILTLTDGTEYSVGSPGEHTLTILDDDDPSEVTLRL
ncbi:MAG: hypothetical protein F4Y09_09590, partial [Rhodothermaceae bacterium]|nr:hypothetical protein [Rhodothermaceae bacterium]